MTSARSERGQTLLLALAVMMLLGVYAATTLLQAVALERDARYRAKRPVIEHCHDTGPCTVEYVGTTP